MKKTIVIDENKCTGCGLCAKACHEGAIGMVDNKARLIRADFCDEIGACLPVCPKGAISFVTQSQSDCDSDGCVVDFSKNSLPKLANWPLQIKLISETAPCFNDADLLIAADCTAFAYSGFHSELSKDKVVIIGCPKLDDGDYSEKLTEILKFNSINSVTLARMEVPCCSGLSNAVEVSLANSKKSVPYKTFVVGIDGNMR